MPKFLYFELYVLSWDSSFIKPTRLVNSEKESSYNKNSEQKMDKWKWQHAKNNQGHKSQTIQKLSWTPISWSVLF